jgi:hypothetical protein
MDEYGETPTDDDGYENTAWTATYDLHSAAADVWEDKAGAVAHRMDFSADGGSFSVSQQYEQYMKQARYHRSRRLPSTARAVAYPQESTLDEHWIGNLPEGD